MSVSRGARGLLVSLSDGVLQTRVLDPGSADRHVHLLSVDLTDGALEATGLFDAPMTHSGDGPEVMAHGGLRARLQAR